MNHEPHCPVPRAIARGENAPCLCRQRTMINRYSCTSCAHVWRSEKTCACSDTCPKCGTRDIAPADILAELLAACESYVQQFEQQVLACGWDSVEDYRRHTKPDEAYAMIVAAIDKAKGGVS